MRRVKLLLSLFILLNAWAAAQTDEDVYELMMTHSGVMNHIRSNYVDDVDLSELLNAGIKGMLGRLDPHSAYFSTTEIILHKLIKAGRSAATGLTFEIVEGEPIVIGIIEKSPAYNSEIEVGDILIAVNDTAVNNTTLPALELSLHGTAGKKINLKFKTFDGSEYEVELKLKLLEQKSVTSRLLMNDNLGYIKCNSFTSATEDEFKDCLESFKSDGINNLIIDLRDNPGGLMDAAIKSADLFLEKDFVIVHTKSRKKDYTLTHRAVKGMFLGYNPNIIILVNRGSASASEVFTAALQDHDRALVIGTNTFGKGLVQSYFALDNQSVLLLTIARYTSPAGRIIQREYKGKNAKDYYSEVKLTDSTNYKSRPVYKTFRGRNIYGGGGIIPDIFIEQKDSSVLKAAGEQQVSKAVKYLLDEYKKGREEVNHNEIYALQLTDVQREEVLKILNAGSNTIGKVNFGTILNELKYEILKLTAGKEAADQYKIKDDVQLQEAVESFSDIKVLLGS